MRNGPTLLSDPRITAGVARWLVVQRCATSGTRRAPRSSLLGFQLAFQPPVLAVSPMRVARTAARSVHDDRTTAIRCRQPCLVAMSKATRAAHVVSQWKILRRPLVARTRVVSYAFTMELMNSLRSLCVRCISRVEYKFPTSPGFNFKSSLILWFRFFIFSFRTPSFDFISSLIAN